MTNETTITIRGWAGSKPKMYVNSSDDGTVKQATTIFNVGVTPRSFNKREGVYQDGRTMWYSVRCYGNLARNVSLSIGKGYPVLVRGRLLNHFFTGKSGEERNSAVIMADSIGIELNSGTASYAKTIHQQAGESLNASFNDSSSEWSDSGVEADGSLESKESVEIEGSIGREESVGTETNIDSEQYIELQEEFIAVDSEKDSEF